jgi:hypothetical protein
MSPKVTMKLNASKPPMEASKRPDLPGQPSYLLMGRARVRFLSDASALSKVLHETYGPEFSISKFERALVELKGKSTLRDKIHLPDEFLALHSTYLCSKVAMLEETSSLKKTFLTAPIETSVIKTADDLFADPKGGAHKMHAEAESKDSSSTA